MRRCTWWVVTTGIFSGATWTWRFIFIVVQAKSTTAAQRQVKASYHKVNIITIKKL